ncbi:MAG: hypothetical protein H6832_02100 [Planctomycetes bacterium]|nr:hypothetical protein [Planctomycetota bacterium]MCB9917181.1 hypothetical protein [Planctomycetota bacterium]
MTRLSLLPLVAVLLFGSGRPVLARSPDVILPGHKSVEHRIVLDWGSDLDRYRFFVSPNAGFHGNALAERGVQMRFSSKYGSRIWAVPANEEPPVAGKRIEGSWPNARVPVGEWSSVPIGTPVAKVITHLRIVAVDDQTLRFETVSEQRFDSRGREIGSGSWFVLIVIAVVGATAVIWMTKREHGHEVEPC